MSARLIQLNNGLRVVLDPLAFVESLTIGVWINVGSRHEPAHLSGLAHLLEHMVFKGTDTRSAFDIVSQIEGRGGSINAYTSRESTAYYCRLLKEDLGLGLDVLADLVGHASLTAPDLDKERQVILAEIHQSLDTPDDIIFDHFQETAFPNQGLGRPVLGSEAVLKSIEAGPVTAFRDAAYGTGNMTLVLSGNFADDEALSLIERRFGGLGMGEALQFQPGHYAGGEKIQIRQDLEQAHLLLGWPGAALEGPGYYAQMVLATLLGGGMSSKLFQVVREEHGLAYSVSAFLSSFKDAGLFSAYAATDAEHVAALIPLMARAMTGLPATLEESDLARAKQQLKASLLMGQESTLSRAESFASQVQVFGKLMSNAELLEPLEAVDLAQIEAVTQQVFTQPMTYALIGPEAPAIDLAGAQRLFS